MNQFISFFPSISIRYQNTDHSNESVYFLFFFFPKHVPQVSKHWSFKWINLLPFFQAFPSGIKTLISQMNQFTSFPSMFLRYQNTISQMNQVTSFFSKQFLRYQNTDQSNESIYFFFPPSIFLTYQRCIYAEILISFLNTRVWLATQTKKSSFQNQFFIKY